MLSCRDAMTSDSKSLDNPLPVIESLTMKLHMMMCADCRRFSDQMHQLRHLMKAHAEGDVGEAEPQERDDH
jgi:predicted anti-sigma-YlaC factor YlaD